MGYDEFSSQIRKFLAELEGPATWSEIREALNLLQKFPNNRWVKRMETDIGLIRERQQGKMMWRL